MTKRRKIKNPDIVDRKKMLADRKSGILLRLKSTYELGKEVLAEGENNKSVSTNGNAEPKKPLATQSPEGKRAKLRYGSGVVTGLAEKHGVHFNAIETARRIADCYDKKYLMSQRSLNGMPLTTNHFAHLSAIRELNRRRKFENRTIKHNWSVRKLAAAIKEDDLRRGHTKATVGNKPVIPKTLPGVVRQITEYCDKWKRWSSTFSAEIENSKDLGPKLKRIQQRLASLDSQVDVIHEMAGALLAPRKAKPSHKSTKTKGDGRPKAKSKGSGPTRKS